MSSNVPTTAVVGPTLVSLSAAVIVGICVPLLEHAASISRELEPLSVRMSYELMVLAIIAPIALGYFFILGRVQLERSTPSLKVAGISSSGIALLLPIFSIVVGITSGKLQVIPEAFIDVAAYVAVWFVSFSGAVLQYRQIERYNNSFKPKPLRGSA